MYWILPSTVPLNGEDEFKCTPQLIVKKWCLNLFPYCYLTKVLIHIITGFRSSLHRFSSVLCAVSPEVFPAFNNWKSLFSCCAHHLLGISLAWLSGPTIQGLVSGKPEPGKPGTRGGRFENTLYKCRLIPGSQPGCWDESMDFQAEVPVLVGDVWSFPGPEDFSA